MIDDEDAPDPYALRPGFDELGRRIVGEIPNDAPSADELWRLHVERNWARRDIDNRPKPQPRRSRRRIY